MRNPDKMKKPYFLLILIFCFATTNLVAQKRHFFVSCYATGDTSVQYAAAYARLVAEDLKVSFPCADVTTESDISTKLKREYFNELSGNPSPDLTHISNDLPHDYWVNLRLNDYTEGKVMIMAGCWKYNQVKNIAEAYHQRVTNDFASFSQGCRKVSQSLMDMLGKYEICAFQGPVSINISATIDSTNTVDYGVYCNESDQQFHQEMVIHDETVSDWKLERMDVFRTEGTMTFNLSEESKLTEENGCYKCKSGREGGRTSTEIRTMKVNGSGISHESTFEGKPQDDTRIELKFLENGTYLVIAKGTSQPATSIVKLVTKAEGTCDNQPQQTKTESLKKTIPLNHFFGPYTGKATDKLLQQKDSKETVDPVTREKTTVTIDFTLKQKDK